MRNRADFDIHRALGIFNINSLIVMKTIITLICVMITLTATAQLQTPQWELPIYITDGTGASDTVYIGIDPTATLGFDSLFEDSTYRAGVDTTDNFFAKICCGAPLLSKKNVLPPKEDGYLFALELVNMESPFTISLDIGILADTLNGVKNMIWDEELQKEVPDVYKGSQIWFDWSSHATGMISPCGVHGGPITRFVGGTPDLPSMKDYPVCTSVINAQYSITFSEPGDKYRFLIPVELKPMNILGSPLVGIRELEDVNVQIYPNPVKDQLTFNNQESESFTAVICDNLSREVKRLELSPYEVVQTDLSFLPAGMHVAELRTSKGKTYKKVLKG